MVYFVPPGPPVDEEENKVSRRLLHIRARSHKVGGGGPEKPLLGTIIQGAELKKLMDGHYTKLPALDDLPGILINDESDDFLSEVDDPSESTSDSQLDCAPSDPNSTPDPFLDYYMKHRWKAESLSIEAELDNTIDQLDNFLTALYSDAHQKGGALSGRNNRRAVAYGHKSSPREQYKGRYTKKALLHGDIHPLLVRYLTETDPVVAREQRVCAANLARGDASRSGPRETFYDLRLILQRIEKEILLNRASSSKPANSPRYDDGVELDKPYHNYQGVRVDSDALKIVNSNSEDSKKRKKKKVRPNFDLYPPWR